MTPFSADFDHPLFAETRKSDLRMVVKVLISPESPGREIGYKTENILESWVGDGRTTESLRIQAMSPKLRNRVFASIDPAGKRPNLSFG
jgi:hypothetical protein